MRIAILIITVALLASPCFAADHSLSEKYVLVAEKKDGKQDSKKGGRVVIRGKGGKVTDVDKKPSNKKKDSK